VRKALYKALIRHVLVLSEGSDTGRAIAFLAANEVASPQPDIERLDELANFSSRFREKWIADRARTLPPGARVLDAGAGQCPYRRHFAHVDYKTQDFAKYQGTVDGLQKEQWDYPDLDYVSDITAIPAPDAVFDCILCTEVLEHVAHPILALKEFSRLLAPSGRLLLSAPLGSGLHQQPYHFYGGFTPHFYDKFLSEFGFHDITIQPIGGLLRHLNQECLRAVRLTDQEIRSLDSGARYLLATVIPPLLFDLDDAAFCTEFTVGYCVEAIKA
jgi:SAM-dependent methyltransferase